MNKTTSLIALAALLGGCADGGSSGTGISTAAHGNVASVTSALAARSGPFAGIRVTIANTSIASATDASGSFSLGGDFAGPVSMIFGLPDGSSSAIVVTVPRGGDVALTDVSVNGVTGQASAASQDVRFDGLVNETTCATERALVVSRLTPNDGNTYQLDLQTATVRSPAGIPLRCQDLSIGDAVNVSGAVRQEGEVEAESVDIESKSSGGGDGEGGGSGSTSSGGFDGGEGSSTSGDGGGTSGSSGGTSGGDGGTSSGGSGSEEGGTSGGGTSGHD